METFLLEKAQRKRTTEAVSASSHGTLHLWGGEIHEWFTDTNDLSLKEKGELHPHKKSSGSFDRSSATEKKRGWERRGLSLISKDI